MPKVYWTVMAKSAMAAGFDAMEDVPPEWLRVSVDDVPFGHPDDAIDAVIDVPEQLPAKVAALRAHATQVTVAPNGGSCALSNNIALPIGALEHYVLVSGAAGARDHRGWETDLLAGLNLGYRDARGKLRQPAARGRDDNGPGSGSQPPALAGPIRQPAVGHRFDRRFVRQHPDLTPPPNDTRLSASSFWRCLPSTASFVR